MKPTLDQKLKSIPHKEKKWARTRIALLQALLTEMDKKPFAEIKIKDLCLIAEISEPTFYNYFPEKIHLLVYFIQIWSLQVSVYAAKQKTDDSGFGILQSLFHYTAKENKKNPRILREIISFQANHHGQVNIPPLSLVERYLLFPAVPGIESIPAEGIRGILNKAMSIAKEKKELPPSANWQLLPLQVASLFFGAPIISATTGSDLEKLWVSSLRLLWLGAGGKSQSPG